jgi:hypothetical protein
MTPTLRGLVFALTSFAAAFAQAAENIPPNQTHLAEVAAGRPAEVRVSWWGFDPSDSTAALQAAIDCGARKVIVENLGTPWITDKLKLASDQEIVFEKGVTVLAKRGAFHKPNDSLFSAVEKKNIILTGAEGAALRMWKQDYDDRAQYTHAEWRHVLSFHSCAGVRITGLKLADSGGDGIYLGVARKGVPCSDVVIKDVLCENNYRQGISVISARHLLIEDCVLKDTWGTAPQAGIDFEPNGPTEELVDCVMRNCVSENNKGNGFAFYLPKLRSESAPLSIKMENCRSIGGQVSLSLVTGNDAETGGVKGSAEFSSCRFEGSKQAAISIRDKPIAGASVAFANCEIINAAATQPTISPITLVSRTPNGQKIGGLRFVDLTVREPVDRPPLSYHDGAGGVGVGAITGKIAVIRDGHSTMHQLTPALLAKWAPASNLKDFKPFSIHGASYEPAVRQEAAPKSESANVRQRGPCEWLLWGEAGEHVSFNVSIRPVGKGESKPATVTLHSPSGKTTKLPDAAAGRETAYDFMAKERGAYRIACDPRNWTGTVRASGHRLSLVASGGNFHFLSTTGRFYFWIPPGTHDFGINVSGEGIGESVKATLRDPAGKLVAEQDNILQVHQFVGSRQDAAAGEIWSIQLAKPSGGTMEDYFVRLLGVPSVLATSPESLLKPLSER